MAKSSKLQINLFGESPEELANIREQICRDINPIGYIEEIYVEDVIANTCEIRALRRIKIAMVNCASFKALEEILKQVLSLEDFDGDRLAYRQAAEDSARNWFSNKRTRAYVAKLLRKFHLDESAIEAAAVQSCAEDLERLDRRLTLAEIRRDKALRFIFDYRQSRGKYINQSNRNLEHEQMPQLVASTRKAS